MQVISVTTSDEHSTDVPLLIEGNNGRGYGRDDSTDIVSARWPTLGRAIGRYQRRVAEQFSTMAYDAVEGGIIRHNARQRLAAAAKALGILPFDAQLLIACAIRQWSLDRRYDPTPRPDAPKLSFEFRSWSRMWVRFALLVGFVVALDAVFLYHWLY
jgi:hypothetical protein